MGGTSARFREVERNVLLAITSILFAYAALKQSRLLSFSMPGTISYYDPPTAERETNTVSVTPAIDIPSRKKGKFASGAPLANWAPSTYHYDEASDDSDEASDDGNGKETTLHGVTVHPFPTHPAKDISCQDNNGGGGLTYVQVQNNTGWISTTPPSVHFRIAQKLACNDDSVSILEINDNNNNKERSEASFRWTTIQDPTHRLIHSFFFTTVSNDLKEPNDIEFFAFAENNVGSKLMERLATKPEPQETDDSVITRHVTAILDNLDFVAVQERMEESLVALAMLMDIHVRDVMHLAPAMVGPPGTSKKLGYFHVDVNDPTKCRHIIPAHVSPGLETYFASPEYQNLVKGERILHQVANKALDLTIRTFNQKEFETNLENFRRAQAWALYKCQDEPSILSEATQFPCMRNGILNAAEQADCVQDDVGCGFKCLDQVADALAL